MRELKLTDKELAALRAEYCGGVKYPDATVRSSLYDTIDKAFREMQQGKAGTIDAEQKRSGTPGDTADEITVSERERRVRRG